MPKGPTGEEEKTKGRTETVPKGPTGEEEHKNKGRGETVPKGPKGEEENTKEEEKWYSTSRINHPPLATLKNRSFPSPPSQKSKF